MKEFRNAAMKATRNEIADELKNIPNIKNHHLNYVVLSFLKKKINSNSVRSFYLRYIYLYIIELAKKESCTLHQLNSKYFLVHLPFVAEMTMAIMYLDNHSLDRKYGSTKQIDFCNNQFGSYTLRKILRDYVKKTFDEKSSNTIQDTLDQLFECVNMGQYLDKNYNHYEGFKNNIGYEGTYKEIDDLVDFGAAKNIIEKIKKDYPQKANYIHLYFTRIFLTTASFFSLFTSLVIELLGYEGESKSDVLDFARGYGILSQVVNDITDVVKHKDGTTSKLECDTLSDLKNDTISLPLIIHLYNNKEDSLIRNFLDSKNLGLLDRKEESVLDELIKSKTLSKAIKICKQLTSNQGYRRNIRGDIEEGKYLIDLSSVAINNRFFQEIFRRAHIIKKNKTEKSINLFCSQSKNELNSQKLKIS